MTEQSWRMKRELLRVLDAIMQKPGGDLDRVTIIWSLLRGDNVSELMLPFSHPESLRK